MEEKKLVDILSRFKDISILVVGDYFLDKHLLIDPAKDEPSLETGLTAYQVTGKRLTPGAAGTITNNLTSLGVGRVIALGCCGNDGEGFELLKGLEKTGVVTDYIVKTDDRVTPTYTKPMIVENNGEREINRIDIKNWSKTPDWLEDRIIKSLFELSDNVDAIIALDQVVEEDYGIITRRVRQALAEIGIKRRDLIIYADSRAFISSFRNIIIKCNKHEVVKSVHKDFQGQIDDETVCSCGVSMSKVTGMPVFITLGDKGQIVVDGGLIMKVPAVLVAGPVDICGAGDAATSGIVSSLCCGAGLEEAALIGNIVSSITIQQLGTTGKASLQQVIDRFRTCFC